MRRMIALLLSFLIVLPTTAVGQALQYTKRNKNEIREGPGNYYPLLGILPKGVPLKVVNRASHWLQIELGQDRIPATVRSEIDGEENWISQNCLVEKRADKSIENLQIDWKKIRASKSSVAAAIRGSALKYAKASIITLDSLMRWQETLVTPREYQRFKLETDELLHGFSQETYRTNNPRYFMDYDITLEEVGIGLGIASRLATAGVSADRNLLRYVNLLTIYLAEGSGAYDVPFRTYVLTDREVKAYAIPGGSIFLSQGILRLCQDEAELSALIAGEMMHIIFKHGLKEASAHPLQAKMDAMMRELAKETGEPPDSSELELGWMAMRAYESLMKPRTQEFEEEADRGAVLLLAKVGYDPLALPRMMKKVQQKVLVEQELERDNLFARLDFQKRIQHLNRFLARTIPHPQGAKNQARFRKNVGGF